MRLKRYSQFNWILLLPILVALLLPTPSLAKPPAAGLIASLEVVNDGVSLMRVGSKNWQRLDQDVVLGAGDRVRTDENGQAIITWFEDGTLIEVLPATELIIEEVVATENEFIMDATLIYGNVFNSVRRLLDTGSRYQVNTSGISATVRGTVFSVSVDAQMNSIIIVHEGTVSAGYSLADTAAVEVTAGNALVVDEAGFTTDTSAISIEDLPARYLGLADALAEFSERVDAFYGERESISQEDSSVPAGNSTTGDSVSTSDDEITTDASSSDSNNTGNQGGENRRGQNANDNATDNPGNANPGDPNENAEKDDDSNNSSSLGQNANTTFIEGNAGNGQGQGRK
jgi:hypothetical protein